MRPEAAEIALFRWIHLSDIHFGHGSESHRADQKMILAALSDDIVQLRGAQAIRAIFVTGDIAFSGGSRHLADGTSEYALAETSLRAICTACGVGLESVYAVPGNHDVDRTVDKDRTVHRLIESLRSGREGLDTALTDRTDKQLLARRLSGYLSFAKNLAAPVCGTDGETPLWWSTRLEVTRNLAVSLVGLNTAILSAGDNDHGHLAIGNLQMETLRTAPASEGELVIVLTHHPLRDGWLRDGSNVDAWLRARAHLHMSGHLHAADSEFAQRGSGTRLVRLGAGAVHGEENEVPEHKYSICAILPAGMGKLKLRVWPRRWSNVNKDFRVDVDNVPQGMSYTDLPLPVVLRSPPPRKYLLQGRLLTDGTDWTDARISSLEPWTRTAAQTNDTRLGRLRLQMNAQGMADVVDIATGIQGTVVGDFRLDTLWQIGAQFIVFRGTALTNGSVVAIKLPFVDYSRPVSFGARELHQAREAARAEWRALQAHAAAGVLPQPIALVEAPNPLLADRAESTRQETFVVEEWVPGLTLDEIRAASFAKGRPDPDEIESSTLTLAHILEAALQSLAPSVFVDISSRNIFWNQGADAPRVRLVDAGSVVDPGTTLWDALDPGTGMGKLRVPITLCYMPARAFADYKAGVHRTASRQMMAGAVGKLLFEMATNSHPLEGEDPSFDSDAARALPESVRKCIAALMAEQD